MSAFTFTGIVGPAGPTGPGYLATSSTSLTIGTGTKTPTTQLGLAYSTGAVVILTSTGSSAWMYGTVTTYNTSTGALATSITSTSGSGTHTDWTINVIGLTGPAGPQGTGLTFRGAYAGGTTYAQGDSVTYLSALYVSLVSSNTGNTPSSSPTDWQNIGSSTGVTSVALTVPSWLSVSGSPITTAGTLAVTAATGQTQNEFLATPNGSSGAVGLRAITAPDLPVFVGSGSSHAPGAVPDPGSTIGSTRFLCETGSFSVPPGSGQINSNSYNWSVTPGGSLTAGSNTITLSPFPLGLTTPASGGAWATWASGTTYGAGATVIRNGAMFYSLQTTNLGNSPESSPSWWGAAVYIYLSAGTGTAEAVPVIGTNTTSTVTVTCAFTHSGAWTAQSASTGVLEALVSSTFGTSLYGTPIHLVNGTNAIDIYATIPVNYSCHLYGDGIHNTTVTVHGNIYAFDFLGYNQTIHHLQISPASTQSGGGGIRLGYLGEISQTDINHIYFAPGLYNGVDSENADNWFLDHCYFYNFTNNGAIIRSTAAPDDLGATITACDFLNYSVASAANAGIQIYSTSAVISDCWIGGTGAAQVNYGINATYTGTATAGGLTFCNNQVQTCSIAMICITGFNECIILNSNQLADGGLTGAGVIIENNSSYFANQISVADNTFQGPGTGTTWTGIQITGGANAVYLGGNTFIHAQIAISLGGSGSVTLGNNNYTDVTVPISKTGTGTDWQTTSAQNGWGGAGSGYANLGFRIEGPRLFFSGLLSGGTQTSGTLLFTLPAGYRPPWNCFLSLVTEGASGSAFAFCLLDINASTGTVTIRGNTLSTAGNINLEGQSIPLT